MQVSNSTGELCRAQITLGSDYKVEILLDTAVSYRGAALHTWHAESVSRVPELIVQADQTQPTPTLSLPKFDDLDPEDQRMLLSIAEKRCHYSFCLGSYDRSLRVSLEGARRLFDSRNATIASALRSTGNASS